MYDLRKIMSRAWEIYRSNEISFAEALHRSWASSKARIENTARIAAAQAAAGITEECMTWSEWRKAGFEVIHGMKALFGVALQWASRGDDVVYNARFFGRSQVQAIA